MKQRRGKVKNRYGQLNTFSPFKVKFTSLPLFKFLNCLKQVIFIRLGQNLLQSIEDVDF